MHVQKKLNKVLSIYKGIKKLVRRGVLIISTGYLWYQVLSIVSELVLVSGLLGGTRTRYRQSVETLVSSHHNGKSTCYRKRIYVSSDVFNYIRTRIGIGNE